MTFVKIVDLVRAYPMPFIACRYLASFSRSQGGAVIRPPPVGTKLAQTPVGARVNVRSLVPSVDIISDYVTNHKIDILCLSETWLRRGEPDVPLAGLTLACRHERRGKRGGGVAIYCRSDLEFSKVAGCSIPTSSRLECVWVNVKCGHNRALVIGCTYRPPTHEGIKND